MSTPSTSIELLIDGVSVLFPYPVIYPEQKAFMEYMKQIIDSSGQHGMVEVPSGTGKTIAILAFCVAYQAVNSSIGKLIYCTRTVPEMEQVLDELSTLHAARVAAGLSADFTGIGMTCRKNLCIHPVVGEKSSPAEVDAACRALVAPWVREKVAATGAAARSASSRESCGPLPDIETCGFFSEKVRPLPPGVHSLASLRQLGIKQGRCPYYMARNALESANVVVLNYAYLIDPKISAILAPHLPASSIVVFDEAHNIDRVCTESLSVTITADVAADGEAALTVVSAALRETRQSRASALEAEYKQVVAGLKLAGGAGGGTAAAADAMEVGGSVHPFAALAGSLLPGSMRKALHFSDQLASVVKYIRRDVFRNMAPLGPQTMAVDRLIGTLCEQVVLEAEELKFFSERLRILLRTLHISNYVAVSALLLIADFVSLAAAMHPGMTLCLEPDNERDIDAPNPRISLVCCDPALAFAPIVQKFRAVVLVSGTLSPAEYYCKLLKFNPPIQVSIPLTMMRECMLPMVVTRGADQVRIQAVGTIITGADVTSRSRMTSRFTERSDPAIIRNYAVLVLDLCTVVPDGMVVFFPSYAYMETAVAAWSNDRMLDRMSHRKLLFFEAPDVEETALALQNYRVACDIGRGAIFFGVARGKVAEGVNFDDHYGRAVVMIGLPVLCTESRAARARIEWLRQTLRISEQEYLAFDAMRTTAQCIGRVIRHKADYGVMILADSRFHQSDKHSKLPEWLGRRLRATAGALDLSTDAATALAKEFLFAMSSPIAHTSVARKSYQDLQDGNTQMDGALPADRTQRKRPREGVSEL